LALEAYLPHGTIVEGHTQAELALDLDVDDVVDLADASGKPNFDRRWAGLPVYGA
jgi:hypothetical protein